MSTPAPHCPNCGYDLRGQTVERCPECNFHYDPPALIVVRDRMLARCLQAWTDAAPVLATGCVILLTPWIASVDGARPFRLLASWRALLLALAAIALTRLVRAYIAGEILVRSPATRRRRGWLAWWEPRFRLLDVVVLYCVLFSRDPRLSAGLGICALLIGGSWTVLGQIRYADASAAAQTEAATEEQRGILHRGQRLVWWLLVLDCFLLVMHAF